MSSYLLKNWTSKFKSCPRSECHRCVSKTHPRKKRSRWCSEKMCVQKWHAYEATNSKRHGQTELDIYTLTHTPKKNRLLNVVILAAQHKWLWPFFLLTITLQFLSDVTTIVRLFFNANNVCWGRNKAWQRKHVSMEIYVVHSYFHFQRTRPWRASPD